MSSLGVVPRVARAALIVAVAGCAACTSGNGSTCSVASTACSPLYAPTFADVYTRTLTPTCAQPGSYCHSAAGVQGGLYFASQDQAYAQLVDGTPPLVIPGDPSCSPLVERLSSTDPSVLMPPGAELSSAEQCAIIQWISDGAMP